ncbi:hypothetical protein RUM44_006616 [Polyplax serrata]|uniref:Uncharacterized protein n=1 Tax=Polyplax serrata TaxID=468196 RepID=A0ABR1AJC0_POLSC
MPCRSSPDHPATRVLSTNSTGLFAPVRRERTSVRSDLIARSDSVRLQSGRMSSSKFDKSRTSKSRKPFERLSGATESATVGWDGADILKCTAVGTVTSTRSSTWLGSNDRVCTAYVKIYTV